MTRAMTRAMTRKRRLNPDRTNEALGWELFEVYENAADEKKSQNPRDFRASIAAFLIGLSIGAVLFLLGLWALGATLSRLK